MGKSSFEQVLRENGRLIYTNVGDSMYPLIKPRDLLIIDATDKPLKKYDIPMYRRDNGQYVLHRVIKVRKNDYVLCGDNRCIPEKGITDRHVLGVLTGIIRDGKELSLDTPEYRLYESGLERRRLQRRIRRFFRR